jgi:hypothetical protein
VLNDFQTQLVCDSFIEDLANYGFPEFVPGMVRKSERHESAGFAGGQTPRRYWTEPMPKVLDPFRCLLIAIAGWMNHHQLQMIDYLREENSVLR